MTRRNTIVIFLLAVVLAVSGYYLLSNHKEEETTIPEPENLETKIKEALDPNKHFDAEECIKGKNIPTTGYIFKKEENFLYIKSGSKDELRKKVRLTSETLFIKMELSSSGDLISEKEIKKDDLVENDSVSVVAFCNPDDPEDLIALIVKVISYQD